MTDDLIQYKLMIPGELKERVQAAAQANGRSLSQEINFTLIANYPKNGLAWEKPTRNELDLEGKVMALEFLVGDLLIEAIESGRVPAETVEKMFRSRADNSFPQDDDTDLPEECTGGARITLGRVSAQVAASQLFKR